MKGTAMIFNLSNNLVGKRFTHIVNIDTDACIPEEAFSYAAEILPTIREMYADEWIAGCGEDKWWEEDGWCNPVPKGSKCVEWDFPECDERVLFSLFNMSVDEKTYAVDFFDGFDKDGEMVSYALVYNDEKAAKVVEIKRWEKRG